ncbi:MAG: DUF2182 domain-containing protein [Nocardioidaceae bacterium]
MTLDQRVPAGLTWPLRPRWTTGGVVLLASGVGWSSLMLLATLGDTGASSGHLAAEQPSAGHMQERGAVDVWSTGWVGSWLLMVVAMMWPLAVPTLSAVRRASFPRWRTPLVLTCLGSVTLLWLAVGLAAGLLTRPVMAPAVVGWWQLAWVGVAGAVMLSARRARLLWRCLELPPLAPGGRRGLVSAARAGLVSWRRCALLCGPVMAAMVVGHSLVLLVCASLAAWWEAAHPRAWHDRVPVALLGVAAAWLVGTEVLPQVIGHG